MSDAFYAHTLPGTPPEQWEPLDFHLKEVARRAKEFASAFGAGGWAEFLGLWHDLGKYSKEFQARLFQANGLEAHLEEQLGKGHVDHSTAGAQHAAACFTGPNLLCGRILAYCIAGHHAGLPDATCAQGLSGLDDRLKKVVPAVTAAPAELLRAPGLPLPPLTLAHGDARRAAFQLALFTRMLFSCLVDADFLATEAFMAPERAGIRRRQGISLAHLQQALDHYLRQIVAKSSAAQNDVFRCRQEVLAACRAAVEQSPGLFSLTVPTGGGKTLASLAFALAHAARHGFERVIYAIPFTSIIEQTADVFRGVFESVAHGVVLEHHSNLDPDRETYYSRLAKENWDAPLIVTTNVQFFESLFASRTSRCRKLHRLARSVVILDEVQTLPVELLRPCLAVLRELAADYHCSIVLCTATQPAITRRAEFPIGLDKVREIIPDPDLLYQRMRRVQVTHVGKLSDAELAERLRPLERFLCIVNTRPHAARLFERLVQALPSGDPDSLIHLSTLMCGQHRSEVIATIRERLRQDRPCRVISTQLVEAGVDLDFPVVFRALAGVDAIAQAAGRCNREGKRIQGEAYVFEPAEIRLHGYLASTAHSTKELLLETDDLLSLDAVRRYFELHYWRHKHRWDGKELLDLFQIRGPSQAVFQFRVAAELFQMIEDETKPIIVPWPGADPLLEELRRAEPPDWRIKRQLQRYTVPVHAPVLRALTDAGDVVIRHDCFLILINRTLYDERRGLRMEHAEPETLMVAR